MLLAKLLSSGRGPRCSDPIELGIWALRITQRFQDLEIRLRLKRSGKPARAGKKCTNGKRHQLWWVGWSAIADL
jgi:hypothetical protein